MSLWAVLLTGLLAGGASCAAVQGGLLAGLVARRSAAAAPAASTTAGSHGAAARRTDGTGPAASAARGSGTRGGFEDLVPVSGFLAGKLVSHVALGAVLGLAGSAVQLTPRARASVQIAAGGVMVLLALELVGVRWVARVTPRLPARWAQRVRRSSRTSAAMGPAALGLASVVLPCGITLSMEVLAIASGSALSGAAIMGVFVLGTSPLFAALGYLARRSATALRGRLSVLAGVAVFATAVLSVNTGLVLLDAPISLHAPFNRGDATPEAGPAAVTAAPAVGAGPQRLVVDVKNTSYTPSTLHAAAGVPVQLVLRTNRTTGCTRGFVIPKLDREAQLPATGETVLDLGALKPGRVRFTCSMGMYSGSIEVA